MFTAFKPIFSRIVAFFTAAFTFIASILGISTGSGKTVTIDLVSNPTTGYYWYCENPDESVAKLSEESYEGDGSGLVGAGGTQSFVFESVAQGSTVITFTYSRAWEPNDDDRTATYRLDVDAELNITATEIK